MDALVVAFGLILYPNALAAVVARRRWDQWRAFMLGNTALTLVLFIYAALAGLLPSIWGVVTGGGLLLGLIAGLVPLASITGLIFGGSPAVSRDIVASGIGDLLPRALVYRIGVQVALTTVLCEEFAFRGVLQVLLTHVVSISNAVLLAALIFGSWHIVLQYNGLASLKGIARLGASLGGAVLYTLLGLELSLVRQGAGGLLAPIITHGVLDVLMFAFMVVRRDGLARRRDSSIQRLGAPSRGEADQ